VSRVSHPTLARTLGVARPKVQHEYASSERPWDNGTRQGQLMFTIDTIMRFSSEGQRPASDEAALSRRPDSVRDSARTTHKS